MALGGGFEIVLACDMVGAARSAKFGLPETAPGLITTCGGLFRGWQSLPLTVAKHLVLTGRRLSARGAYELSLVNRLFPVRGDGERRVVDVERLVVLL
ncbi:Enoyl-CoA hydratase/isomerase [Brevibacterium sp. Mu109]|uniref:enoyl-CoA hydratase-related protein n=1 Tax=Brevibacterium sp. Mu109 TaxID=1255669 RepID=UPI000C37102E|nr:enoyl-CoA hydratase-related protein [Brevibacterium sp. Mu109]SMX89156.1 Enoyl-CoA hydratase/isomerase [Brevibacterium sp. Mu109]